jgi:hypothetical protein
VSRREAGRRARVALQKAKDAHPMSTKKVGKRGWTIEHSGQERNLWFGYHLAYKEVATGKMAFVDMGGVNA